MKRSYWEDMAARYNEEIFDVRRQDKKALITRAIKKYADPSFRILDIGCAIGKWFPVLSPLCKEVIALDISAANLKMAKASYAQLTNITYLQKDMSKPAIKLPACELGICINALLTPVAKDRRVFFKNLSRCIVQKGKLIVTVPSLESYLLSRRLQQEYRIDRSVFPKLSNAPKGLRHWNNLLQGVCDIDEVPHKHFLAEELQLFFSRAGFTPLQLEKIEYNWKTEFNQPPRWLGKPYPWDWMMVVERN
ncbi:MAG: class I SAM-dependent methyltransferase [Sphingomonadales bacterium]